MENTAKMQIVKATILATLMIVFGVLCIVLPQQSFGVVVTILGWACIIFGLVLIASFFMNLKVLTNPTQFVVGVILILLGIMFLCVSSIFIALLGFGLAVYGIQYIGISILKNKMGYKSWWQEFIIGLVEFLIGIVLVVLCYSGVARAAIMIYLGISIIIDAIFLLVIIIKFGKDLRQAPTVKIEMKTATVSKPATQTQQTKTTTASKSTKSSKSNKKD